VAIVPGTTVEADSGASGVLTKSVTLGTYVGGEFLLLVFQGNQVITDANFTGPGVGWTRLAVAVQDSSATTSAVYYKFAVSGDSGTTVTCSWTTPSTHAILTVTPYSGVDPTTPIVSGEWACTIISGSASTTRVPPAITIAGPRWVLNLLLFKQTGLTGWTTSGSYVQRYYYREATDGGDNGIALYDSNGTVPAGTTTPDTYTTVGGISTSSGTTWSIALNPASTSQSATVAMAGSNTMGAAGQAQISSAVTVTGSNTMGVTPGASTHPAAAAMAGANALSVSPGASSIAGTPTFSGGNTMTVSSTTNVTAVAVMAGGNSFAVTPGPFTRPAAVAFAGANTTGAGGTGATSSVISFTGVSTVGVAGIESRSVAIAFSGVNTVTATGTAGATAASVSHVWVGAPTSAGFVVTAKVTAGANIGLNVSTSSSMTSPTHFNGGAPDSDGYRRLVATGLSPHTQYYYQLTDTPVATAVPFGAVGKAKTLITAGTPGGFTMGFGGCTVDTSDGSALLDLHDWAPDLFAHLGDFHYNGSTSTTPSVHAANYHNQIVNAPSMQTLLRDVPSYYEVSDHEAGPDNGDSDNAYTAAHIVAYKQVVPYGTLIDTAGTTTFRAQTFDCGRVSFFLIDNRSTDRSPGNNTDNSSKTLLGATQKAALKAWLLGPAPFKVILGDTAWAGPTDTSPPVKGDWWPAYNTERQELISYLAANASEVQHVEFWHSDTHSIGYVDPGDNSWGGFPVLCAAPFDNTGGGRNLTTFTARYNNSGGACRIYGRVTFTDDGTTITRRFDGYDAVANAVEITQTITVVAPSVLPMTGANSLGVAGRATTISATPMTGVNTLSAAGSGSQSAGTAMAGSNAMSTAAAVSKPAAAPMSGTNTVGVTASGATSAAAAIVGANTLAVAAAAVASSVVAMAGANTFAAAASIAHSSTVTLTGNNAMGVNGTGTFAATVAMAGANALSVTTAVNRTAPVALVGSNVMGVTAAQQAIPAGLAMLGANALQASATGTATAAVALTGTNTLSVGGTRTTSSTITMLGVNTCGLSPAAIRPATAAIAGTNVFATIPAVTHASGLAIVGANVLTAMAIQDALAQLAFLGSNSLGADGASGPHVGRDITLGFTPLPDRWRFTALQDRWSFRKADDMDPINLAEGAVGYVGGTYTEIAGNNITAATVLLAVGTYDASGGDWRPPDIAVQGETVADKIVKLLISNPSDGGYTPTTDADHLWGKLTDDPEIDARRLCRVYIVYPAPAPA
jgi:hypothetical protein